jgi:hypothetical protein
MADDEDVLGNPLSIEDDQYEIVHEAALTTVLVAASLDLARTAARRLVEHGLGATVAEASPPDGYEVRVLPEEAARATELLDAPDELDEPDDADGDEGERAPAASREPATAEVGKVPVPWRRLLLTWVAAMILIPLAAGVIAYLLYR